MVEVTWEVKNSIENEEPQSQTNSLNENKNEKTTTVRALNNNKTKLQTPKKGSYPI